MAGAEQVVLLTAWPSSFGNRVRIALAEKGVEYEYVEEDLSGATAKSPRLLRSNPVYGKVPVLLHGGRSGLCESLVIVEYVDEIWGGEPLLPRDPLLRANARFWADFVNKNIYWPGRRIREKKGEKLREAKEELVGNLRLLEAELGEKPYLNGDSFGYLDIALVPFTCWFYTYERFGGFSVAEEVPALEAWARRCLQRESVAEALPDPRKIYEFTCQLNKKLGIHHDDKENN